MSLCQYWLPLWLLRSDKKSTRNEDTFGQKKKDIYGKKKVRPRHPPLWKQIICQVILLHVDTFMWQWLREKEEDKITLCGVMQIFNWEFPSFIWHGSWWHWSPRSLKIQMWHSTNKQLHTSVIMSDLVIIWSGVKFRSLRSVKVACRTDSVIGFFLLLLLRKGIEMSFVFLLNDYYVICTWRFYPFVVCVQV